MSPPAAASVAALYRAGDYFNNLYVVRLGFLKSTVMSSDGREQVTNFFMAGEMIGLDGISSNVYSCDVVALEDTEVCVLPFDRVEQATTTIQTMGKHFQKLLSREIVRQHGVMLLLGSMHAEERLAAFLLCPDGWLPTCTFRSLLLREAFHCGSPQSFRYGVQNPTGLKVAQSVQALEQLISISGHLCPD